MSVRRHLPVAWTLCLGSVLSLASFFMVRQLEFREVEARFHEDALSRMEAIERELRAHVEAGWALQSLYGSSETVTREEFRTFANQIISRHSSIQALEWIPRVPRSQRDAYEAQARTEGHPDFRIAEQAAEGGMVRAEDREEYFPVYYLEPYLGNEMALGYDLASDAVRLKALHTARDTGSIALTERITLVQAQGDPYGFLAFLPFYGNTAKTNTVEERRENLNGFILGVHSIGGIIEKSLSYLEPTGIDVALFDVSTPSDKRLLYFRSSGLRDSASFSTGRPKFSFVAGLSRSRTFNLADRTWQITATPSPDYLSHATDWHAWAVVAALLVITVLTALIHHAHIRKSLLNARHMTEIACEVDNRKKAEKALALQAEIINQMTEAVYLVRLKDGIIIYTNPRFEKLFGYEPGEMIGKHVSIVNAPIEKDPEETAREIMAITLEKGSWQGEILNRKKDGTPFLCWANVSAFDDEEHGKVLATVHIDITERKELEKKLHASELKYRMLVENLPGHTYTAALDERSRTYYISPQVQALIGYSPADYEADPDLWVKLLHADDRERVLSHLKEALETNTPFVSEYRMAAKDGRVIWFRDQAKVVSDRSGKPLYLQGVMLDITDRKAAEEKLEFTQFAVDRAGDAAFWMGPDARFIYVNDAACRALGYTRDEMLQMSVYDISHEFPEEAWPAHWQELKEERFFSFEAIHKAKDGRTFPVEITVNYVMFEGKEYNCAFARNITERKKAEETLTTYLTRLQRANKELSDFAYIVSHDLKEPIRAVNSLAKWMLTDYGEEFDEAGREKMDLLIGRVRRMNDLVEGILQYSRAGRIRREHTWIDVNILVSEVIDILKPGPHIRIRKTGTLPILLAERSSIHQVFQNLIGNAMKYMDKPQGEIEIGSSEEEDSWTLFVSDNGPGIDEKDREKIFQMFGVLQPRDKVEASGVGLAVVKKIIEMYGGRVWVESHRGKGSTFCFTIPKDDL